MNERITDRHIQVQALQHLLIHYEKKRDRYSDDGREDILNTLDTYIAKIRRTMIRLLQDKKEDTDTDNVIKFY